MINPDISLKLFNAISRFHKYLLIGVAALLASSCAPTISNFHSYQKQLIPKTSFMPSEESLSGEPYNVVVFELNEEDDISKQSGLGYAMAIDIENVLTQNRLAKLIDRKAAKKLEKEITLAEMNKTGSYNGPQVADYAVSGAISNAGFIKKYSSGRVYLDTQGQLVTIPPKHTYKSNVTGNVKIYELPSMEVVENFDFTGSAARSENVQKQGGLSLGIINIGVEESAGIDRDDDLVRKAGEDAIDDASFKIKNFFAKRGYILEKRILKSKSIFKVSLGSADGITQGDIFEIIGKYEIENPITNKFEIEKRIIATGKVADKIDPKSSWVIIDNKKSIDRIRIGDTVRVKYKRSFLNKASKLAKHSMSTL